jgi:hypothetical protein
VFVGVSVVWAMNAVAWSGQGYAKPFVVCKAAR